MIKDRNEKHCKFSLSSATTQYTHTPIIMVKIEIHGTVASPPTRATLIVAKAIGVEYDLVELNPHFKTPEFKKLSPQQQIPVLVDNGFILPESRAIIQYLVDKYAKDDSLYPKDLKKRAVVNARLNFDCGTLWPRVYANFIKLASKEPKENLQVVHDAIAVVEEFLTRDKWIAGDKLTIADISFSTIVEMFKAFDFDMSAYPKTVKWLEECRKNIPNYSINDDGITSLKQKLPDLIQLFKSKKN